MELCAASGLGQLRRFQNVVVIDADKSVLKSKGRVTDTDPVAIVLYDTGNAELRLTAPAFALVVPMQQ